MARSLWDTVRVGVSIAAVVSVSAVAAKTLQPGWVTDPKNDCRVWNPNPQENETVSWSGGCRDGLAEGRGVLQWFRNERPEARYEGELRGGRENGYGVLTKPKARYEGEFRDGRADGSGHFVGPGVDYTGLWTDGCLRDGNRVIGVGRDASSCP